MARPSCMQASLVYGHAVLTFDFAFTVKFLTEPSLFRRYLPFDTTDLIILEVNVEKNRCSYVQISNALT